MIPLVRSSIFNLFPEIVSGVSTRLGGASPEPFGMNMSLSVGDDERNVMENRWRLCDALGIWLSRLVLQKQVHGDSVSIVEQPGVFSDNDALITREKNIFLAVSAADCQPVFLFDKRTETVAAIHAGWRGAAKHIVAKTLRIMQETLDTHSGDVFAFVGPCASQCCYEVDEKVALQFERSLYVSSSENKYMLDLKGATLFDLLELGVPRTHIEISPLCTICNPEFFHSFRRDGVRSGRMLGIIGMR